ncbi:hypothetical protein ASD11_17230 [Aeromicrobium sp. Root495]|uniref:LytR C-terminal domain-containing protein n=1 Tax=Aeromicrobium sp. Root495 TaxID=1736550 RepID=UPI0006F89319|nr:LytR C-terminal domain-containing protein [Aeromicrobium sp. Root495]KQY55295.1 hypothetical protein ASD11_17230 [Aeromicrobium sp. Root495]
MNRASTPVAIGVSAIVLVLGLLLGVKLVTAKADTTDDAAATCTDQTVARGETLSSNLVKVNVLNASQRSGLANRVSINLQRRGFLAGDVANSTSKVAGEGVTILDADKDDPIVHLVAIQFTDVSYVESDLPATDGVTVVVGDDYKALRKKSRTSFKTPSEVSVCVPQVTIEE